MRTHPLRPDLVLALACLLAILLFFLGTAVPQAHLWGSLLLPIVLVFLWGRRRDIYIVTALASLLLVAAYWTGGIITSGDFLANHLLPILILWAVAWLLAQHRQRQAALDEQVSDRTAALEASEQQQAKLFRANPGAIAITRQSDGCYLDANPAYLQLLGYSKDELVGRRGVDLNIVSAPTWSQIVDRINRGAAGTPFEVQLNTKAGGTIDIMTALDTIDFADEPCYVSFTVDVTARKAAEREHRFLSALVASSPDAIVGRMVDGTILSWNHGAEQLFGYTAAEAVGQNLTMLAAPGSFPQMQADMTAVGQGTPVEDVETQRMAKDGRVFDCRVSLFPVRASGGEVIGVASFTHDISERKRLEETVTRLAAIVESSPDAIVSTDLQGRVVSWNRSAEQMYGCSAAKASGRPIGDLLQPYPNTDEAAIVASVRGGATVPVVDRVWTKADGTAVDLSIILSPVKDVHGAVIGMSSVARDITQRKRLEAELRQSEERFRAMFAEHAAAMLLIDPATGAIVDSNQAASGFYGYTNAELRAMKIWDINTLPSGEVQAQMQRARNREWSAFVFPHRLADNTVRDVEVHSSPITVGSGTLLYSIIHDVTARRQAEEALHQNEQKFRTLFEQAGDGIFYIDPTGHYLDANARYCQMLGRTRDEVIGAHVHDMTVGVTPEFFAAVGRELETKGVATFERRLRHKDGSFPEVEVTVAPLGGDRRMAIVHDISERKFLEESLAASERKYRDLYDNSPDMYMSGYLTDRLIRDCNQTLARTLGYTREELIGQPISMVYTPAAYSRRLAELPKYTAVSEYANIEMQLQCKDGTVLDVLMSGRVDPATADRPVYGRITFHDITERKRAEAALTTSEARLRAVIENTPDSIWSLDCNCCFLVGNAAFARVILQQIGRPIAVGESVLDDPFSPRTRAFWQPLYDRALAGESFMFEMPSGFQHPGGTLACYLHPIHAADGTIGGVSCRAADITALMQVETQLRESQARYQMLADHATDVIWTMDPAAKVTYVSPSSVRQSGFTPEETMCQTLDEAFAPSSRTAVRAAVGELYGLIRSGLPAPGSANVYELMRKDGTTYWGETIYSVVYNEQGEFQQIVGATREVTKRAHAEQLLREAYQRLRLAADAANIGIWNWNVADDSLEWDDRMYELYGVTAEERPAKISYDFWRSRVHLDDLALAEPVESELSRLSGLRSDTFRIVLPGSVVRYIQASSARQYDHEGKPRRVIGINRDITDQKLYEQLLQETNAVLEQRVAERTVDLESALAELRRASQLKDEFMAMISHELRTPLTGVLSMSEMLEEQIAGPLNDRQAFYVKGIITSGERLLNIVNSILGYTHLLSGKAQMQAEPCDLAYLLDICAASQQHKAAEKHQVIAVQVTPPDLAVTSDATAVAEVLKRLLDNAVKFTPAGGRVGLDAHPGSAAGTVDLVVWDTGIGIAADQQEHVFHAFTQADGRLQRSHEGIGMGLAYVDQMVRLLGGTLALESTPGQGSRFTITLPA